MFTTCEVPRTMLLNQGPVLKLLSGLLTIGGAVMWNGLENVLKDEINLDYFKSSLSFFLNQGLP